MAQSDIMTSPLLVSFHISSQWACCSTFKYLANACCSSCSVLQKPSSFPSSTCIVLLRGDYMYVILWGYFMKFPTQVREEPNHPVLSIYDRISSSHWSVTVTILPICAAAVFLTSSQQHVCGCIDSSKSRYLLCSRSSIADIFRQVLRVYYHAKLSELSWYN